eukprot:2745-Heterococcus_DN1.PRE.1
MPLLVAPAQQLKVPTASSHLKQPHGSGKAVKTQELHFCELIALSSTSHNFSSVLHAQLVRLRQRHDVSVLACSTLICV